MMFRSALRKLEALVCRIFVARVDGQTNVEFSLILLLVGVAGAAGFNFLGTQLSATFGSVNATFARSMP